MWKLKLDDKGNVVVNDGKPVYVKEDGTETTFDANQTAATISRLNGEAKTHRTAKEEAEARLKAFEGIADPAAALAALETVSKIDAKQLVDSKGIDALRSQMTEAHANEIKRVRAEFEPVVTERDSLRNQLHAEKVGNAFATSKFVAEKLAVPVDMVQATFGSAFKVEDGKIVAYKGNDKIFSPANFGEPASFDEALSILVDGYANKDSILKGTGMNGGGSGGGGRQNGGKATYKRAEFDRLDPMKQAQIARDQKAGKAEIVD